MAKTRISEYDASAGDNTDVNSVNIAEGCPPSGINNAIREVMAALKRFETGADGDSVTVGGNLVVSGSATLATTAISSADINAGTIDGTTIGGSSAAVGTFTTANATTVDTTNIEVTNIKAKDGTAAATIADSTGKITVAGQMTIDGIEVGQGAGNVATNTAVGAGTLQANTTGQQNLALGYNSLYSNTTGSNNAAVGYNALAFNTTASNNTAVGYQAGYSNTTGPQSTLIGTQAGYSSTAGYVTALGYTAAYSTTTGTDVVAVGWQALKANTTGSSIIGVGDNSLYSNTTGNYNVAMGHASLFSNTTASNNTAVGYQAGYANTTGTEIAAFGHTALYSNTTGNYNSSFGRGSMYNNTTGANNTAVGYQALVLNTTASNNTAVGYQAGYSNTTGALGTFLGYKAGYASTGSGNCFVGPQAGLNSTGTSNTFIGSIVFGSSPGCGADMTTGSKNTILGGYNGNQGGLDIRTASNYIVLSDGDGNPRAYWDSNGNFSSPPMYNHTTGSGANAFIRSDGYLQRSTSSLRYKNTVNDATHGLTELLTLRPVTYKSNNDGDTVYGGLIAEEVHAAGLTEFVQYADDGSPDALAYGNMVSLCIKAIQEQQAIIESLKSRIETLENK